MTGIDPERMKEVLPQVIETIEQYANLDPAKDLVPIKPTAHYTMGGIPITTDGEVYRWADGAVQVVDGLFAAGECSCVSVHGANPSGRQFSARRLPVRHTRWSDDGRTHRREPG